MNITEKAKEYAEGKAMEALTSAIEKAYTDGYNAGLNDASKSKGIEFPRQIVEDGVKYVDLGLDSGTLWSFSYLTDDKNGVRYVTYEEALKLNIPTKKQFEEMKKRCQMLHRNTKDGHYISCIGIHGEHIELHDSYIYRAGFANNKNVYCFWLKNENEPENDTVECASGNSSDSKQFIGYKLPVMLVK